MITFWICTAVFFCILFLVVLGNFRAEWERAEALEADNRRLDMENLRLTTRIHNLDHALDVALRALYAVSQEAREERAEVLRKAFVKRHTDDIERITREIEERLRG